MMKRLMALAVVTIWVVGAVAVNAGEGCCLSGKAKADGKAANLDPFAKLDLTADQKTKLAALKQECTETKCTIAAREKFMKGVKDILSPEQQKQFEAECNKAGCPMKTAESKAEKKG